MNILAIIPARIGSKGVREKNLLKIGNYSLVERALFTAMGCKVINRIIVSSDSKKTIDLVNKYGDYAPFKRASILATDQATSLSVIQDALTWAEKSDKINYQYIVLLEPPSPFRLPVHIEKALEIAVSTKASSVVSVVEVGDYHPIRMKKMKSGGALKGILMDEPDGVRRQDQDPVYIRNCAVYVFDRKTILSGKLWGDAPYGYLMDRSLYAINIDEQIDVITARTFYNQMLKKKATKYIESFPEEFIS